MPNFNVKGDASVENLNSSPAPIVSGSPGAAAIKIEANSSGGNYIAFTDSNGNTTWGYFSVDNSGNLIWNGSSAKFNSIKDSTGSSGSSGSVLKSDGTNIFWDSASLTNPLYKGTIVRGYTMGGYQNTVAYNTVYKTIHSTDTTTNLGSLLDFYNAYTAGASSGTHAYDFYAYSSTGNLDSGNKINKFNMTSDTKVNLSTTMTNSKTVSTAMRYRFIRAYIFGNTDPEKFIYSTETPSVASTTWDYRLDNAGAGGAVSLCQNAAYGDDIGYYALTGIGRQLQFSTETWSAWIPTTGPGNVAGKNISTFNGHIYWKYSTTQFAKFNSNNASTSLQTIITPQEQQEENFHTGENKGYMVGMYRPTTGLESWLSTGSILDYTSDTFVNSTTVNAPVNNSSASGVEYGKFSI